MVPNTKTGENPLLLSILPAKVSSMTPIWDASAVSLIKSIKNANAGGKITFHACGNIISLNISR